VATVPHVFSAFDDLGVDFYAVSMHKMFGPHVGALIARRGEFLNQFACTSSNLSSESTNQDVCLRSMIEKGTLNIEGCAGVVGLGQYMKSLAQVGCSSDDFKTTNTTCDARETAEEKGAFPFAAGITINEMVLAYANIRRVEENLTKLLLLKLSKSPRVKILQCRPSNGNCNDFIRLPTISFVHDNISSSEVVHFCNENGIVCRYGLFLNTSFFACDFGIDDAEDGVVRVSLAHYNTTEEVCTFYDTLQNIPGW
jgi:selenocysteine lyase/cysteine desulfurase